MMNSGNQPGNKPAQTVNVAVDANPSAAILETAKLMQQSFHAVIDVLAQVQSQQAQLLSRMSELRPKIEVSPAKAEFIVPARAKWFEIETDKNGNPLAMIPHYDDEYEAD